MSKISRRIFLQRASLLLLAINLPRYSLAQLEPFYLEIRRLRIIDLSINGCIEGELWTTGKVNQKLADTLELPFRNNLTEISSIPAGKYLGKVREDGSLGWRIEFEGVEGRKNIQIHPGNVTKDSLGCILVGQKVKDAQCSVTASRLTINAIRTAYGTVGTRQIWISVK